MPSAPFPEQVDAGRLFARNGKINAALSFARLKRFTDFLADPDGHVEVSLSFNLDEQGRRRLQGNLQTRASQVCQRCLQPMQVELYCELDVLVLGSDAELQQLRDVVAETTDVIVADAPGLDVIALIEDELILSLPLVPLHQDATCSELLNSLQRDLQRTAEQRAKPFSGLGALLDPKHEDSGNKH